MLQQGLLLAWVRFNTVAVPRRAAVWALTHGFRPFPGASVGAVPRGGQKENRYGFTHTGLLLLGVLSFTQHHRPASSGYQGHPVAPEGLRVLWHRDQSHSLQCQHIHQ